MVGQCRAFPVCLSPSTFYLPDQPWTNKYLNIFLAWKFEKYWYILKKKTFYRKTSINIENLEYIQIFAI